MTKIFIIFMLVLIVLAVILLAALGMAHGSGKVSDRQYLDDDGDHIYYDRASIEKKTFARNNPGVRDVRTFRRLFRRK